MKHQTILIIGKNGKTGSRVEQLLQTQGYSTRGVSRSTTPAFDWRNSNTWSAALEGVNSAYVTFQPDLAIPEAEEIIREFVAAAKIAGLEHLVLLSGRGEDGAQRAEQVLQKSGLSWNVVRASWFAQNFSENFMLEGIQNGELVLPASDVPEPFVDIDDLAEVAVAALTRPQLRNRVFEVTGPQAITFKDCVQEIARQTGRTIQYIPIPVADFIDGMKAQGFPKEYQWLINELFTVLFDGRNTPTADGVEQALGRPASSFSDYVKKTAASGIWNREKARSA